MFKFQIVKTANLGFSEYAARNFELWAARWRFFTAKKTCFSITKKIFKPKCDLPMLPSYDGEAPDEFWKVFPKFGEKSTGGTVNGQVLRALALQCGYPDRSTLDKVCEDLLNGARIGCKGEFRKAGKARNAPSAIAEGYKVTDSVGDWVGKGYAKGPFELSQIPKHAKFSGLMARPKPNGAVRVIMNLSAPKGRAVNDGIDSKEFPTAMSSTSQWLEALWRAGRGCEMVKVDWSDAYKHVPVHEEDSDLQYFCWLGKAFKETRLVFGGASSAGIFDRLNKVVIFVVAKRSGMDMEQICQVLDDCCACAPRGSDMLEKFDREFTSIARALGIKLAPRDDPEKSFGPSTEGIVLGVKYNTVDWTWGVPDEKLGNFLVCVDSAMAGKAIKQKELWSLVGKLLHLAPLVPGGRFNLYHLLKANSRSEDPGFLVEMGPMERAQLKFWKDMLQVCSGVASIPNPAEQLPPWTVDVFTDAAGGTTRSPGHGVGAVTLDWWVYLPWGRKINAGWKTVDGKGLDRVMSARELVGPLLALCAAAKARRVGAMRYWVDNAGSVYIWKKGYSTSCALSTTVVTAIACVAAGLGAKIDIVKIGRCSNNLASMADALSKASFGRFWDLEGQEPGCELPEEQLEVPQALIAWVANPVVDWDLGRKLLVELSQHIPVLAC